MKNKNDINADFAILQMNKNKETDKKFRTTFFIRNHINEDHYFGVSCIIDNSSFKHTCNQDKIKVVKHWKENR